MAGQAAVARIAGGDRVLVLLGAISSGLGSTWLLRLPEQDSPLAVPVGIAVTVLTALPVLALSRRTFRVVGSWGLIGLTALAVLMSLSSYLVGVPFVVFCYLPGFLALSVGVFGRPASIRRGSRARTVLLGVVLGVSVLCLPLLAL
jgi:hypothetical protein